MIVWLVQTGEAIPVDPTIRPLRTGMLGFALAQRGHDVLWWTSAFEHQRKRMIAADGDELLLKPGVRAKTLRGIGYRRNVSLRRYVDHRLVARSFARHALSVPRPDVMVVSTPCYHIAFEAARFAVARGIPFVLDARDLWPDIFVDRVPTRIGKRVTRWVLRSDYERLAYQARSANVIVSMSNGTLEWALRHAGRSKRAGDRVFYLGHPGLVQPSDRLPAHCRAWFAKKLQRTIFTFIGTFGESYELDLILGTAARLHAAGREDIGFVFAGDGRQRDAVMRAAECLPNVLYCGWVDASQISDILRRSDVGLVACRSVADAAPNKLFEYTAAGLPVLSSLIGEMAAVIEQRKMGFNYPPGDATAFEQVVTKLADAPVLREQMAMAAQTFHVQCGEAPNIYADYLDLIEEIATGSAMLEMPS